MVEVWCKIQYPRLKTLNSLFLSFIIFFNAREERVRVEVHFVLICTYCVVLTASKKKKKKE